jgi:hypothetical protein
VVGGVWKKCEKLLKKKKGRQNFFGRKIHKFALGAEMASHGPVSVYNLASNFVYGSTARPSEESYSMQSYIFGNPKLSCKLLKVFSSHLYTAEISRAHCEPRICYENYYYPDY